MEVVKVEQGMMKGVLCDNGEGTYFAFKGIPYAKPPLGRLRFKVISSVAAEKFVSL